MATRPRRRTLRSCAPFRFDNGGLIVAIAFHDYSRGSIFHDRTYRLVHVYTDVSVPFLWNWFCLLDLGMLWLGVRSSRSLVNPTNRERSTGGKGLRGFSKTMANRCLDEGPRDISFIYENIVRCRINAAMIHEARIESDQRVRLNFLTEIRRMRDAAVTKIT